MQMTLKAGKRRKEVKFRLCYLFHCAMCHFLIRPMLVPLVSKEKEEEEGEGRGIDTAFRILNCIRVFTTHVLDLQSRPLYKQ